MSLLRIQSPPCSPVHYGATGQSGLEPLPLASKARMLPLHHKPTFLLAYILVGLHALAAI